MQLDLIGNLDAVQRQILVEIDCERTLHSLENALAFGSDVTVKPGELFVPVIRLFACLPIPPVFFHGQQHIIIISLQTDGYKDEPHGRAHCKSRMMLQLLEDELLEDERLEDERLEDERLEDELLEDERLEDERLEDELLEDELLEDERLEDERLAGRRTAGRRTAGRRTAGGRTVGGRTIRTAGRRTAGRRTAGRRTEDGKTEQRFLK